MVGLRDEERTGDMQKWGSLFTLTELHAFNLTSFTNFHLLYDHQYFPTIAGLGLHVKHDADL